MNQRRKVELAERQVVREAMAEQVRVMEDDRCVASVLYYSNGDAEIISLIATLLATERELATTRRKLEEAVELLKTIAQDIAIRKNPRAYCQSHVTCDGYVFKVYADAKKKSQSRVLGEGATEEDAWLYAAAPFLATLEAAPKAKPNPRS